MPLFEYKGATRDGKETEGVLEAENQGQVKAQLKKDGIFIFNIKNKTSRKKTKFNLLARKKVDIKTLCNMTRLLATLIKAQIPLVDSLSTLTQQVTHPVLSAVLLKIRDQINEGEAFHKALGEYPKIFDSTYVSMCRAGESSGTLDIILLKLADFTENQAEINNKVRSALAYPSLIMVFTVGVVLFLFTYVIPKITALFEDQNVIPWHTDLLIFVSQNVIAYWFQLLIGSVVLLWLIYRWTKTEKGSEKLDHLYLRLPFIGKIIRATAISRFSRTLATLLKGGVPMLQSMEIVQSVTKNKVLKKAIKQAKSNIREGEPIAAPLKASGEFPPMAIQMIKIGEQTGELENMMVRISDTYDFQIKTEINAFTSLLPPIMIMIMGGGVAFIIFSVMTPIMDMYNQIGDL